MLGVWKLKLIKKKLFADNNIPASKFYVAGMGTATSRKGIDLFLQVCKVVARRCKDVCFVWIGDFEDEFMSNHVKNEVVKSGLQQQFFITGKQPSAPYNLAPFDVFFLSSREDPYPLVVLEAAQLKIPSIYFEGAGGIGEFVGVDAGWPVAEFNIEKAAATILHLKENTKEIAIKGRCAFERVLSMHMDKNTIVAKFDIIINKYLKENVD